MTTITFSGDKVQPIVTKFDQPFKCSQLVTDSSSGVFLNFSV